MSTEPVDTDAVERAAAALRGAGVVAWRRTEHRVEWGNFGWSCSCGRVREGTLRTYDQWRAAALRHQAAEWRKLVYARRGA